jgi:LmbE family N-acetylglucosaminyl deacetylase
VVFLTNGGASHSSCCGITAAQVGQVRQRQAVEAAGCLGLNTEDLLWLQLRDGEIPFDGKEGFDDVVANLATEFDRLLPAEIYCPHPHDGNPDHAATSRIVCAARERSNYSLRIVYYTVWTWYNAAFPMHRFFNWSKGWKLTINSVFEKKAAATNVYLNAAPAPCGCPYCGRLPKALVWSVMRPNEIFFDGDLESK